MNFCKAAVLIALNALDYTLPIMQQFLSNYMISICKISPFLKRMSCHMKINKLYVT